MTFETHVFVRKQDIPSARQWAQAIVETGLALVMPRNFALPENNTHFIPCNFENLESGFDLRIEAVNFGVYNFKPEHRAQIGDRDTVFCFKTHSNAQEMAGMIVASGVLAEQFNGIIVSELQDEIVLPGHNTAYIQEHLAHCREQFIGPCGLRETYDPQDPTANTIPMPRPWLGFALLAFVGIAMLIDNTIGQVKSLAARLSRN